MCILAVRFLKFDFSDQDLFKKNLKILGEEVLIRVNDKNAYLSVYYDGKIELVEWGIQFPKNNKKIFFCKKESLISGKWAFVFKKNVQVNASFALSRGVWFQVRQGLSAVMMKNINGEKCVCIITEPSTHYFEIMTGSKRMPVLINQIL